MTQKEKVVAHVAEVIHTLGVKSVRMDDVAQSLGMSKRTLYEMFGDKDDLLFESIKYITEKRPREILAEIGPCENSLEMLFKCSHAMLSGGAVSDIERRMAMNLKKFYPVISDRVHRYHTEVAISALQNILKQACDEGYIEPNIDFELMIRLMFSIVTSAVYENSLIIPEEVSREEAYGAFAINFFRGISTHKGIDVIDAYLAKQPRRQTLEERRAAKQNNE
ncbi:MAG: TetR/AcrR family transcriptional regulator [Alistipes sp.]|nr:TetR/AcrR family transcriptional regulator [Alistipes sp.]